MRRYLLFITCFYGIGIYLINYVEILNNLIILLFIIGAGLGSYFSNKKIILLAIIFLLVGNISAMRLKNFNGTMASFNDKEISVIAYVINEQREDDKITVKTESLSYDNKSYELKEKILVKIRNKKNNLLGQYIRINGTLKEIKGPKNPREFNYRIYLKSKNIFNMIDCTSYEFLKKVNYVYYFSNKIKENIYNVLLNSLEEKRANLAYSLITGDKTSIDSSLYNNFRQLGLSHILAISGLHIGMIYAFIYFFTFKNQFIKRLVSVIVFIIYIILTTYSVSIIRATFMFLILEYEKDVKRPYDSITALSGISLILLVINPYILFDMAFIMSVSTVASIILFHKKVKNKIKLLGDTWSSLISISICAQIGIIPVLLYNFNSIGIYVIPANLMIVGILTLTMPLIFGNIIIYNIFPNVAILIGKIINISLMSIINISFIYTKLPLVNILIASPKKVNILIYYIIIIVMAWEVWKFSFSKKKIIIGLVLAAILINSFIFIKNDGMKLTFFYVGQGDSILIETPKKKRILIDGGPVTCENKDKLVKLLLRNGISKIDTVILSHSHLDHIGGLVEVFNKLKVKQFVYGVEPENVLEFNEINKICINKGIEKINLFKGDIFFIEKDIKLICLNPESSSTYNEEKENDNSLTFFIKYKNFKGLFTGDIEGDTERDVVRLFNLKADLLKMPHHGSNTSSTEDFVKKVGAKVAIVQVGKNLYGHPDEKVIKRYERYGYKVFRTDEIGAIIVKVLDDNFYIINR